jgi:alpha-galactosidase/6-phospho-beta-glucosidase family protein
MLAAAPLVKTYALCSCTGHPSSAEWLAEQAGVEPGQIAMPPVVAGLNHCASVTELRLRDGSDAMPLVRAHATNPIVRWALATYGVLPYCWSHWVEHFPQMQRLKAEYAGTAQGVAMRYGITTHDMAYEKARVAEIESLAAKWTAPDAGRVTLADLPPGDEDWGIEVIDIIEAIRNLPDDAVVEVNASVNGYGIRPIAAGPLPEPLAAHLRGFVDFERHVVTAALSGDRDAAMHAFLLDPNIQSRLELEQIGELLDEMLRANAEWLPLFQAAGP